VTVEEILAALEAADFGALVGVSEDGSIDFKGEPHQLRDDAGKYELAKDVASFASGLGPSLIVFPIETELPPDSRFERVSRPRPTRRDNFDETQIRAVVASHVYPPVRGLEVRTYPSDDDPDRCLVAILIPPQEESDKPFLVLSPVGADGAKIQGWLIGLPTRAGDSTDHIREAELHEIIVRGRGLATRIEELATMVAGLTPDENETASQEQPAANAPPEAELLLHRARSTAERLGLESVGDSPDFIPPALVLEGRPVAPTTVPSLFRDEGVRQVLERPPATRHEGWNLETLARAELVEGTKLELRGGDRMMLALSDDGQFTVIARLIGFLARDPAAAPRPRPLHKINSLALVEYTYNFVSTYKALAEHFEPRPQRARFGVTILAATGSPAGDLHLPPGGIDSLGWQAPRQTQLPDVPDYPWTYETDLDADTGAIAVPLLERVYAYFKNTTDGIPYLTEDRTSVDTEQFGR
jgi:hypothetical protein